MTPARLAQMKPRFRKRWSVRWAVASVAVAKAYLGAHDTYSDPNRALHRRWLQQLKRERAQKRRGAKTKRLAVERAVDEILRSRVQVEPAPDEWWMSEMESDE